MSRQRWEGENRKTLVCVDSYDNGILCGRCFDAYYGMERFDSLSQFLIKMEARLEAFQTPQAYTIPRSRMQNGLCRRVFAVMPGSKGNF